MDCVATPHHEIFVWKLRAWEGETARFLIGQVRETADDMTVGMEHLESVGVLCKLA